MNWFPILGALYLRQNLILNFGKLIFGNLTVLCTNIKVNPNTLFENSLIKLYTNETSK